MRGLPNDLNREQSNELKRDTSANRRREVRNTSESQSTNVESLLSTTRQQTQKRDRQGTTDAAGINVGAVPPPPPSTPKQTSDRSSTGANVGDIPLPPPPPSTPKQTSGKSSTGANVGSLVKPTDEALQAMITKRKRSSSVPKTTSSTMAKFHNQPTADSRQPVIKKSQSQPSHLDLIKAGKFKLKKVEPSQKETEEQKQARRIEELKKKNPRDLTMQEMLEIAMNSRRKGMVDNDDDNEESDMPEDYEDW